MIPVEKPSIMATSEVVAHWMKKRELSDRDQMKVVALLIGHLKNGVLP